MTTNGDSTISKPDAHADLHPPRRFKAAYAVLAFIVIMMVGSVGYTYRVDHDARDRATRAQCAAVTQVKDAVLELAQPASKMGVTDPATLARIDLANEARSVARHKLNKALACAPGGLG